MKNIKKDNKGFSLVELIVVVLIMAIIAVALAPQILKWVNNSRISSDNNTMQQLIANAQTAVTNETVYADLKKAGASNITITIVGSGVTAPASAIANDTTTAPTFSTKFYEYCGTTAAKFTDDYKVKQSNATITITVEAGTGKVTGTITGGTTSVDN